MNRPNKRPDSSFLIYRKRVPDDLRPLIGKTEIKISLRTRDPLEAKAAHARIAADVEARFAQLRLGTISLSQKQSVAMAGEIYRDLVAAHEDNPGDPNHWTSHLLVDWAFLKPEEVKRIYKPKDDPVFDELWRRTRINRHSSVVEEYLSRHGYRLDADSLTRLKLAANEAIMQGREQLLRNAKGDYRPDPSSARFPKLELANCPVSSTDIQKLPISAVEVFDRYSREAHLKPATIKRWRPIVAKVENECPDLAEITPEWVVQWKDRLVAEGLNNNTIRDAYLAAMRTLCNWAKANRIIPLNPFAGVSLKVEWTPFHRTVGGWV